MAHRFIIVLMVALGTLGANTAHGQSHRRIGRQISGHIDWNAETRITTDTATFTFPGDSGEPVVTLEFVAHYAGQAPAQPPSAIDLIATQQAVDENRPDMTMTIDGHDVPLVPRPRTRRSVVATLPFDAFLRMASAQQIVERAFDTELEFGTGQIAMLRSVAARWSGSAR